jgi:predicted Zn-dependent protease
VSFLANLSRVFISDEILPTVDESIANEPATPVMLMLSADLHWRRREWQAAIEAASRVLDRRPKDFHALAILLGSHGHLQQFESALPYAKRLLLASPPHWRAIKVAVGLLTFFKLCTAKGRTEFRRTMLRCDAEAQSDRDALAWAQELLSAQGAADDAVAV